MWFLLLATPEEPQFPAMVNQPYITSSQSLSELHDPESAFEPAKSIWDHLYQTIVGIIELF
jgi:hypothetical protein